MAAFVTDQFRILNAGSFVDSISNNSYYAFLGLSNPTATGFGRNTDWNTSTANNPIDNYDYLSHYRDTSLFGKKITSENVRRVVKKYDWISNTPYDMYRHDYRDGKPSPVSDAERLYSANYYVVTSEYKVYICIENGSSGTSPTISGSTQEPNHTDIEPVSYSDGYRWKYLYKISPADIIKFDSTEYITLPNNWSTSTDSEIQSIRDGGNSDSNSNQIKTVYIEQGGTKYTSNFNADIIGDGVGATASVTVENGTITKVIVTNGGYGYTYGSVKMPTSGTGAKLIPIIPPSRGHGFDIYQELGADKVLLYARFDDSTKDFPTDTKFSQVGVIKNPETFSSTGKRTGVTYTANTFSSLYSIAIDDDNAEFNPNIGDKITQNIDGVGIAKGYVASYDKDSKILKYYQDRSLSYGYDGGIDQTHSDDTEKIVSFVSSQGITVDNVDVSIDTTVDGTNTITTSDGKVINLDVTFTEGLANPEINKKTGDIIYIDNRPIVQRDSKQKEDVKIILEF